MLQPTCLRQTTCNQDPLRLPPSMHPCRRLKQQTNAGRLHAWSNYARRNTAALPDANN
jgi:hypothetical protein